MTEPEAPSRWVLGAAGPAVLLPLLFGAATIAAIVFAGGEIRHTPGFPLDDAWIHMVYGRGLLQEGLLAYDPGTPSSGSTSPLWALVVAAAHAGLAWRSVDAVVVGVMCIGALLHLLTAWLVADLLGPAARGGRWCATLGGSLVASSPVLAAASLSGMEVTLCGCLLVASLRFFLRRAEWSTGWALALATLCRPESAAVSFVCFALLLAGRRGARAARAMRLALPSLLCGAAWLTYNLLASGRAFPATFYMKQSLSLTALPGRFGVALTEMLPGVSPLIAGVAWLGLLGYATTRRDAVAWAPLLGGAGFLLANLAVVDPMDPAAFYHLRYLLPGLPLLIAALAVGWRDLGARLPARFGPLPLLALTLCGVVGVGSSLIPAGRRLHNDVRNINEVQRAIGVWLAEHTREGSWIAASDAGAIRYFSNRPTLDLMGLNTPELLWDDPAFARRHPVAAIALMPSWFVPRSMDSLVLYAKMETENYTVTSFEANRRQIVLGCSGPGPIEVRFSGARDVGVVCEPDRLNP